MPRAQLIALRIGKVSIIHITSPRDNGMPNAAEAIEELTMGGERGFVIGSLTHIPTFTSKLACHLQSASQGERKLVFVTYSEQQFLAVIERTASVDESLSSGCGPLPLIVGIGTHSEMCLQGEPITCTWHSPEMR